MDLDDMDLDDRHLDDADLDVRGVRWETNVPLTPPIVAPFMHGHSTTAPEATAPPPRVGVASVQGEVEWDEIETYEAHSRTIVGVCVGSDGGLIWTASWDGTVAVYSTADRRLEWRHKFSRDLNSIALYPNDDHLAVVGCSTNEVVLIKRHRSTGNYSYLPINRLASSVYNAAWSPDGRFLTLSSFTDRAFVYQFSKLAPTSSRLLHSEESFANSVIYFEYTPDMLYILGVDQNGEFRVLRPDVAKGSYPLVWRTVIPNSCYFCGFRVSKDSRLFAVGNKTGAFVYTIPLPGEEWGAHSYYRTEGSVSSCLFSADGKRLIVGTISSHTIHVFDIDSGNRIGSITMTHATRLLCLDETTGSFVIGLGNGWVTRATIRTKDDASKSQSVN